MGKNKDTAFLAYCKEFLYTAIVFARRCLVVVSCLAIATIARYTAGLSNGNNLGLYFLNMSFSYFLVSFFHEEYQKGISH
jgi:hypothetical protein